MGLVRVSFFFPLRRPFYSFFDGVVLLRSRGRAGKCGGLLVQRSVGNRAVSRQMGTAGREW